MESRMAAMGRGEGPEGLNRKEKGLMDLDHSVVIEGGLGRGCKGNRW